MRQKTIKKSLTNKMAPVVLKSKVTADLQHFRYTGIYVEIDPTKIVGPIVGV